MSNNHSEIPNGYYCYTIIKIIDDKIKCKPCPHLVHHLDRPEQECGECTKFDIKDWIDGTLLWDSVKECGINVQDDDDMIE